MNARSAGQVHIVGAGLLGTSIGLALRKLGVDVTIEDMSPGVQALAIDYGAGRLANAADLPALIVVCVPPDVTAGVVAQQLERHPTAVVTDVASVKQSVLSQLQTMGVDLARYVGSHPMAGRERGGAGSGRSDLFVGRVWVISPNGESQNRAIKLVEDLALDLGSSTVRASAADHDRAVALVSHLPQIVSSLTAGMLLEAEEDDIVLAGQGLRDTTRIAASDPKLWLQILSANAEQVTSVLSKYQQHLSKLITALESATQPGALATIDNVLSGGNRGVERLPGKHGTKATKFATVTVMIDDKPGELARLLTEIGEIGVNLEEINLEHSPSSPIGLVEVSVLPSLENRLVSELTSRSWKLVG